METWTHRRYTTALAWMSQQLNRTDKLTAYLMQIGAEIRRVLAKDPNAIKIEDLKIRFGSGKPSDLSERNRYSTDSISVEGSTSSSRPLTNEQGLTVEQVSAISKARWFGAVGIPRGYPTPGEQQ